MNVCLEDGFTLDCDHVMASVIGPQHGLSREEIQASEVLQHEAIANIQKIRQGEMLAHGEPALFMQLPYQSEDHITRLMAAAVQTRQNRDAVVSIGIGGSYLGNKTIFDALCHPYYNECPKARAGNPRLYFAGENVDPGRLSGLCDVIDLKKTTFVVISKSGGTTEPAASFLIFMDMLKKAKLPLSEHVIAVTDPKKGLLREICVENQIPMFQVPYGIGGRFSVLSDVGLLTAAMTGVDIRELLRGAAMMDQACQTKSLETNPALLYAAMSTLLYKNHGKNLNVVMPYCSALKSLGEWYVQLLAESLGKAKNKDNETVYEGRTPIPALGTTDMHAQTQQHQEGQNTRLITMIRVNDFSEQELTIPAMFTQHAKMAALSGLPLSRILHAALEANARSLASAERPNCTIGIECLSPYSLGQLFFFFEMATAFEGEMLHVNTYDQPGVEAYKLIMTDILANYHH